MFFLTFMLYVLLCAFFSGGKGGTRRVTERFCALSFARRKGILFSPPQSIRTAPPKGGAENQKNFSAFLRGGLHLAVSENLTRDCVIIAPKVQTLASPSLKGRVAAKPSGGSAHCELRIVNLPFTISHRSSLPPSPTITPPRLRASA